MREPGSTSTVLLIMGMRNNGCRESIAGALGRVDGVQEVHVNLYRAQAVIVHEPRCTVAELIQVVIRAGYGVRPRTEPGRR